MKALLLILVLGACATSAPTFSSSSIQSTAPQVQVADVFERVESSVVTIVTTERTGISDSLGREVSQGGIGSGVLISLDGKIFTASHVVQTADSVEVRFLDGSVLPARVIGSVPQADVAMVQVIGDLPQGIAPAVLGDSNAPRIGSKVFVVGAPNGLSHTLTVGHLSARRVLPSSLSGLVQIEALQTDATINTGNSGGPMFSMEGEVVGIVSYIVSKSGGSEGLGFAIASNVARKLLLDCNAFWSGMDFALLSDELASAFNLPRGVPGLLVQHVAKDSPAERLGLKGGNIPIEIAGQNILIGGDVILFAFGISVGDPRLEEIALKKLGQDEEIELLILRGGERLNLKGTVKALTAVGG